MELFSLLGKTGELNWFACLVVMAGVTLQRCVGIGFALVSAPLLYWLNPAYIPGPILLLGWSLSLITLLSDFCPVDWRRLAPALLCRFPGVLCGAWLLLWLPPAWLGLLFGLALLAAVWVGFSGSRQSESTFALALGGFFSGVMATTTSVGGPPIALVYLTGRDGVQERYDLAMFFLIGTSMSLIVLFYKQLLSQEVILLSIQLLPAVLVGSFLGQSLTRYLSGPGIRRAMVSISAVTAVLVTGRAILVLLQ